MLIVPTVYWSIYKSQFVVSHDIFMNELLLKNVWWKRAVCTSYFSRNDRRWLPIDWLDNVSFFHPFWDLSNSTCSSVFDTYFWKYSFTFYSSVIVLHNNLQEGRKSSFRILSGDFIWEIVGHWCPFYLWNKILPNYCQRIAM